MGVNLGLWQVRHQSNLRYANSNGGGSARRYNSVRTQVQRPVASINSILSLGDSYTDSAYSAVCPLTGLSLSPTSGCALRANAVMRRKFGA